MSIDLAEDGDDLLGGLAAAVNDLGKSRAQRTVVIHGGELELGEGQVSQPGQGFVNVGYAVSNPLEKLPDRLGIH